MFNSNIEIWKNAAHGGGPWTRSIEGDEVHGPSQDKGSMFCTFPPTPNFSTNTHDPPLFGTGNYNTPPPPILFTCFL